MNNENPENTPQRVFVTQNLRANFTCPQCGKVRHNDVSKFQNIQKEVKLKCKCTCGNTFHVVLERRRHLRRAVSLSGTMKHNTESFSIEIIDISRNGMLVKMDSPPDIASGSRVTLDFILDDTSGSRVKKEVVVRNAGKETIGVEFTSQDHYDKLGPYLLFHFN